MAGLYLHIPFCWQKCNYCDFFSAAPQGNQLKNWHQLLQRNLHLISDRVQPLETIFFGGGTPSLLSPEQVAVILRTCHDQFLLEPGPEISLEANPADLTEEKLAGYLEAGINRLSLGVQSFCDLQLQLLGRRHSAQRAVDAYQAARRAGFKNISIDLIFALPGQNLSQLGTDLDQLLELDPEHVGIYGLSIEEGTTLQSAVAQGALREPAEEFYAESYLFLSRRLESSGYEHYEISNFARPGFRCRHNQGYWQRTTCFAAGCGAHGFEADGYGRRTAIPQDLELYRQNIAQGNDPAEELELFTREQAMAETLYLGLRTRDGIDCTTFAERFGQLPDQVYPEIPNRLSPYLLTDDRRWRFNVDGWLLYDHLISHFLTS